MRQMLYILLLAIIPVVGICQFSVKGKVVDGETNKAIAGVSVYINNSFLGTSKYASTVIFKTGKPCIFTSLLKTIY
jgi:hypothetical protein